MDRRTINLTDHINKITGLEGREDIDIDKLIDSQDKQYKNNSYLESLKLTKRPYQSVLKENNLRENTPIEVEGYGNSVYDENITLPSQLSNINQVRYDSQNGLLQLGAGITKAGIIGVTTWLDGMVGTAVGAIQAIGDELYSDEKLERLNKQGKEWGVPEHLRRRRAEGVGDFFGKIFNGNNLVSYKLNELNKWSEEALPVYKSEEYLKNEAEGRWDKNVFSTSFIGDNLIKNMGFMVGAGLSAKGVSSIASKTLGLNKARNAFKGAVALLDKGLDAEQTYKALLNGKGVINGVKLTDELAKQAKIIHTKGLLTSTVGSIAGAIGESRIEAIDGSEEWANNAIQELENSKQDMMFKELRNMQQNSPEYFDEYGNITDEGREAINNRVQEQYDSALEKIQKIRAQVANQIFIGNAALLSVGDFLQWGKFLRGGFNVPKQTNHIVKKLANGNYQIQKTGLLKGAGRVLGNSLVEGHEEMAQEVIKNSSQYFNNGVLKDFTGLYLSPEGQDSADNILSAYIKGMNNVWGNKNNYQNFFIGAISSMIGMPSIRLSKNKNIPLPTFEGNIYSNIKEIIQESKDKKEIETQLNNWVNNSKTKEYRDGMIRHISLAQRMEEAAIQDDKMGYETLKHAQNVSDAIMFDNVDRLDDYKSNIQAMQNLTDEDIEYIRQIKTDNGTLLYDSKTSDEQIREEFKSKSEGILQDIDSYVKANQALETLASQLSKKERELLVYKQSLIDNLERRRNELIGKVNIQLDNITNKDTEEATTIKESNIYKNRDVSIPKIFLLGKLIENKTTKQAIAKSLNPFEVQDLMRDYSDFAKIENNRKKLIDNLFKSINNIDSVKKEVQKVIENKEEEQDKVAAKKVTEQINQTNDKEEKKKVIDDAPIDIIEQIDEEDFGPAEQLALRRRKRIDEEKSFIPKVNEKLGIEGYSNEHLVSDFHVKAIEKLIDSEDANIIANNKEEIRDFLYKAGYNPDLIEQNLDIIQKLLKKIVDKSALSLQTKDMLKQQDIENEIKRQKQEEEELKSEAEKTAEALEKAEKQERERLQKEIDDTVRSNPILGEKIDRENITFEEEEEFDQVGNIPNQVEEQKSLNLRIGLSRNSLYREGYESLSEAYKTRQIYENLDNLNLNDQEIFIFTDGFTLAKNEEGKYISVETPNKIEGDYFSKETIKPTIWIATEINGKIYYLGSINVSSLEKVDPYFKGKVKELFDNFNEDKKDHRVTFKKDEVQITPIVRYQNNNKEKAITKEEISSLTKDNHPPILTVIKGAKFVGLKKEHKRTPIKFKDKSGREGAAYLWLYDKHSDKYVPILMRRRSTNEVFSKGETALEDLKNSTLFKSFRNTFDTSFKKFLTDSATKRDNKLYIDNFKALMDKLNQIFVLKSDDPSRRIRISYSNEPNVPNTGYLVITNDTKGQDKFLVPTMSFTVDKDGNIANYEELVDNVLKAILTINPLMQVSNNEVLLNNNNESYLNRLVETGVLTTNLENGLQVEEIYLSLQDKQKKEKRKEQIKKENEKIDRLYGKTNNESTINESQESQKIKDFLNSDKYEGDYDIFHEASFLISMMKPVMLELGKPFTVENIELQDKGKWGIYNLTLNTKGQLNIEYIKPLDESISGTLTTETTQNLSPQPQQQTNTSTKESKESSVKNKQNNESIEKTDEELSQEFEDLFGEESLIPIVSTALVEQKTKEKSSNNEEKKDGNQGVGSQHKENHITNISEKMGGIKFNSISKNKVVISTKYFDIENDNGNTSITLKEDINPTDKTKDIIGSILKEISQTDMQKLSSNSINKEKINIEQKLNALIQDIENYKC